MANGTLKVGTITTSSGSGTITIGQSGETVTVASGATQTIANNTPSFLVKKTSSQAINDVTKTLVTWDSEEIDTDSAFASNKFTVPTGKAGKYFFSSVINLEDSALYATNTYFYKNGTEYASSAFGNYSSSDYMSPTLVSNIILDLSVGDYIEVYAQGNTSDGGTLNVFDNGGSTLFSWFQGFKLT